MPEGSLFADPWGMLLYIGLPAYLILYVFARFRYAVEGNRIVVRCWILGFIPTYRRSFCLDRLLAVRRFQWRSDFFSLASPLGRTFSTNRTVLEFSGPRPRKIVITPRSFEELRSSLSSYLNGDEARRGRS